jgi:hypothetical protein
MAINLTDVENCANPKRIEAQHQLHPDPNHQRRKETNMAKHPIEAESALCNSNIIALPTRATKRVQQSASRDEIKAARIDFAKSAKPFVEAFRRRKAQSMKLRADVPPFDPFNPKHLRAWESIWDMG